MYTNISARCTKYATLKNTANCNLNAIIWEWIHEKRESKELPEKDKCRYQIYISINLKVNIQSDQGFFNVGTMSDISHISQLYADNPKQCSIYAVGIPTALHMYIGSGDKTLLINMHKRPCVCNPVAY